MDQSFHGAKAAVFVGEELLVYQRDAHVIWPDHWDFPGGGREKEETPEDCVRREIKEEFGLDVPYAAVMWRKSFPSMIEESEIAWFLVVKLSIEEAQNITFGSEGQRWALMSPDDVAKLPNLVPGLGDRLSVWLQAGGRDHI